MLLARLRLHVACQVAALRGFSCSPEFDRINSVTPFTSWPLVDVYDSTLKRLMLE